MSQGYRKARITIDLDVELLDWVMEEKDRRGVSRNILVAEALEKYRRQLQEEEASKK
jgi:hypothetical protein